MVYFFSKIRLACFVAAFSLLEGSTQQKTELFKRDKKNEWHLYTSRAGKNNDPQKVFQFEEDVSMFLARISATL
ncbi:MAG: hypothetical protein WKI04_08420 [Ferruginibacter sp.]